MTLSPVDPDRVRGALVGLAVGDALGTTLEFRAPGSFEPLTDLVGGGPFGLPPGAWTDDTSMALCLAESLVETGGFDPVDQLRRFVRWFREGHLSSTGRCFDIGTTTRAALATFEATGQPNAGEAVRHAGASSRTTHALPECVDACRYFGALLVGAVRGASVGRSRYERGPTLRPGRFSRCLPPAVAA